MTQETKVQAQESKPVKKEEKPAPAPTKAPDTAGLSLRDHFAAQALVGLLCQPGASTKPSSLAETSYRLADAMLAARPKGEA